jgi:hypothetical protein
MHLPILGRDHAFLAGAKVNKMKISNRNGMDTCITTIAFCIMVLLLPVPVWLPNSFGDSDKTSLSAEERLRLGERMYRKGILPSGKPMKAFAKGNPSLPGTAFSCESCHLRSGLGSLEGNVFTPPTNGAKLFKPLQVYSPPPDEPTSPFMPRHIVEQNLKYYQTPRSRPIYTDESLAYALRDGIDSAGRIMNDIMPRYRLEDEDMRLLISYLKSLSSEFSPGVSDTTLRFATIITDDVSPEAQNAMLVPLENFIRNENETNFLAQQPEGIRPRSTGFRSRLMAQTSLAPTGVAIRKLSLSRWVLKGSPETWRNQLEEYSRNAPVFAILGGITKGEWQPIHQFCEENQIPSIFPITDYPVISQSDWYTLYLSKGYYQEGEGAASFLNDLDEFKDKPIVQIVRDTREGHALSRGFLETWRDFGQKAPVTVILKAGEKLTAEFLQQKLVQENASAIILWDGSESLKALEMLAAGKNRPAMVLVSSSYLGKSMFSFDEKIRDFTYLTYPYGITQLPGEKNPSSMGGVKKFNAEANAVATIRTSQQSYILTVILSMALTEMRENYYRDNLLDVIGMIMDQDVPLYERLSFGQGQRYASKGCYIVQLGKSGLVKKSGWLIH